MTMATPGVFCYAAWSFQIQVLDRLTADEEAESQKGGFTLLCNIQSNYHYTQLAATDKPKMSPDSFFYASITCSYYSWT